MVSWKPELCTSISKRSIATLIHNSVELNLIFRLSPQWDPNYEKIGSHPRMATCREPGVRHEWVNLRCVCDGI